MHRSLAYTMRQIMTVPFSHLDEWEMNATLFQDTIYIEESHDKKLESRQKQYSSGAGRGNMSQDLMSFWGYKFESVSLLPKPWSEVSREDIESREEDTVSNYAQYCSIVRTGFGKTKIIIGGEVDAVEAFKPGDPKEPINWVELKTTAQVNNDRDVVKLERKLLKFWAQSFLLGVPKIVVGYRSQQGMLERLEEMETQTIPDRVARGKRIWDGQTCINFTSSFLEWLKETITSEGTWRIRKREKVPYLEVFKVEDSGTGDILSKAFIDWRVSGKAITTASNDKHHQNGNAASSETAAEAVFTVQDRPEGSPLSEPEPEDTPQLEPTTDDLDMRKAALLGALHQAIDAQPP